MKKHSFLLPTSLSPSLLPFLHNPHFFNLRTPSSPLSTFPHPPLLAFPPHLICFKLNKKNTRSLPSHPPFLTPHLTFTLKRPSLYLLPPPLSLPLTCLHFTPPLSHLSLADSSHLLSGRERGKKSGSALSSPDLQHLRCSQPVIYCYPSPPISLHAYFSSIIFPPLPFLFFLHASHYRV